MHNQGRPGSGHVKHRQKQRKDAVDGGEGEKEPLGRAAMSVRSPHCALVSVGVDASSYIGGSGSGMLDATSNATGREAGGMFCVLLRFVSRGFRSASTLDRPTSNSRVGTERPLRGTCSPSMR